MAAVKLHITLAKSLIGRLPVHRRTVKALGLGRVGSTAEHDDTPVIRGMIRQVDYLLAVEER